MSSVGDPVSVMLPHLVGALAGLQLLIGLWTPGAGIVLAVSEVWIIMAHKAELRSCILMASLGVALAMIGPGAWSLDAYLYGWKRIDIPTRKV